MKSLFFVLVSFQFGAVFAQKISFGEYFPLQKGVVKHFYVSHITGKDTLRDKNCISICKSEIINGREVFYFDDRLQSDSIEIIGSESFCNGVFFYDNGNFLFSPLFWKYELNKANLDYFETLFPGMIAFDTVYKYQDGEEKRKYKFNGFESINLKGKPYNDCLKLTIIQDWKTAQHTDTVWFYKGTGVIKWLRSTGRLEEIKL